MPAFWNLPYRPGLELVNPITRLTSVHARLVDAGWFTLVVLAIAVFDLLWKAMVVSYPQASLAPVSFEEEMEIQIRITMDVHEAYTKFSHDVTRALHFGWFLIIYLLVWHFMTYSWLDVAFFFVMTVAWFTGVILADDILQGMRRFAIFLLLFGTGVLWAVVHDVHLVWAKRTFKKKARTFKVRFK